jgi:hypothetical protein
MMHPTRRLKNLRADRDYLEKAIHALERLARLRAGLSSPAFRCSRFLLVASKFGAPFQRNAHPVGRSGARVGYCAPVADQQRILFSPPKSHAFSFSA